MGRIQGRDGNIKFNTNLGTIDYSGAKPAMTAPATGTITALKNMSSYKIDIDKSLSDVNIFGMGGWAGSDEGLMSYSGSCDGFLDKSDTDGQEALRAASLQGAMIYIEFYMDKTHKYCGNIHVGKMSIDNSASESVKFSFDFKGEGALCE